MNLKTQHKSSSEIGQFNDLTPEFLMTALEELELAPTGEFTALNSYENRVYEFRLETPTSTPHSPSSWLNDDRIIVKVYRPQRWSREALLEEHEFVSELKGEGLSAVPPLTLANDSTVFEKEGFFITLFPKIRGRLPQEFLNDDLEKVGKSLAHLHNIGARKKFTHRLTLEPRLFDETEWQLLERVVSPELWNAYQDAIELTLGFLDDEMNRSKFIRIHGDCHRGNLLNDGKEFFFVDFDDSINGPPVQDFWMLSQGFEDHESLPKLIKGYEELREFDDGDLILLPALRAYRIFKYAGWIAKRWKDPTFPQLFPQFGSYSYWVEELKQLRANIDQFAD